MGLRSFFRRLFPRKPQGPAFKRALSAYGRQIAGYATEDVAAGDVVTLSMGVPAVALADRPMVLTRGSVWARTLEDIVDRESVVVLKGGGLGSGNPGPERVAFKDASWGWCGKAGDLVALHIDTDVHRPARLSLVPNDDDTEDTEP